MLELSKIVKIVRYEVAIMKYKAAIVRGKKTVVFFSGS